MNSTKEVNQYGTIRWKNAEGKYHREDGPAVIYPNGSEWWYTNGKYHREDGPAVTYPNGDEEWFINGERHREDGPAVTYPNGDEEWYLNGKHYKTPEEMSLKLYIQYIKWTNAKK
jgi:hypothetical protein